MGPGPLSTKSPQNITKTLSQEKLNDLTVTVPNVDCDASVLVTLSSWTPSAGRKLDKDALGLRSSDNEKQVCILKILISF
jgi:hypothetical protein